MEDYIKLAEDNQKLAWDVIRDAKIIECWKAVGAEINLIGSLKTGLLMKHRDIDFHIYTPQLDIAISFEAIKAIAENPLVKKISFINMSQEIDNCFEWHAFVEDERRQLWQIDMIHMSKCSRFVGVFENIAAKINQLITPEQRKTVLRLKYETPEETEIHGIEYYQAVMQGGVQEFSELMDWQMKHPFAGINLWIPGE